MKTLVIVASLFTFGSFAWGMISFFRQPAGRNRHATLLSILAYLILGWHEWALANAASGPLQWAAALGTYAASFTIFWMAIRTCGRHRLSAIYQPDLPQHLVQTGPYRHVRHPFYLSYTLAWLAAWVATGNHLLLISVAIMVAGYVRGARNEEAKFARSPLRGEYLAYRRRAGMLLPLWGRR